MLSENPADVLRNMHNKRALEDFEPSLSALDMSVPKGYRHKDVLEHSIKVLENAISYEEEKDLILRTAALLHDIGKPATRKFENKGIVTFQSHDFIGSKIVKKILRNHGYSKDEINKVSDLVKLHMRSHTFVTGWSDSAVRRLMTDAKDQKQLDRLIIIFKSDITTRHKNKENSFKKSINELSIELEKIKEKDLKSSLRPSLNGNEVAELLGIKPGRELGRVMKFLYLDENLKKNKYEAVKAVLEFVSK